MDGCDFSVSIMIDEIQNCNGYLELKKYKNAVLSGLFELDNKLADDIVSYWEETMTIRFLIANFADVCDVIQDIIETYYRTIITDKWADEVGEKYYY